jgi:hypothetical protein
VESALKFGGINFAAGERHSLENALVPECRFLIRLFQGAAAIAWVLIVYFVVSLRHENGRAATDSQTCHHDPQDSV